MNVLLLILSLQKTDASVFRAYLVFSHFSHFNAFYFRNLDMKLCTELHIKQRNDFSSKCTSLLLLYSKSLQRVCLDFPKNLRTHCAIESFSVQKFVLNLDSFKFTFIRDIPAEIMKCTVDIHLPVITKIIFFLLKINVFKMI